MAYERTFQLIRTTVLGLCSRQPQIWDGENDSDRNYAKAVCGRCPIRRTCLANALEEEGSAPSTIRAGVRGGLDGIERYNLWRHKKKQPKPVAA